MLGGLLVLCVVVWDRGWEGLTAAEHFGVWGGGSDGTEGAGVWGEGGRLGGVGGLDLGRRWSVEGIQDVRYDRV